MPSSENDKIAAITLLWTIAGVRVAVYGFMLTLLAYVVSAFLGLNLQNLLISQSPEVLLEYESNFGQLHPSFPFCYRTIDYHYKGDEYFRTYYLWGFGRETPNQQWLFYQRKVTIKRLQRFFVSQWEIFEYSEWKRSSQYFYNDVDPAQPLRVIREDLPKIASDCGTYARNFWYSDEEIREADRVEAEMEALEMENSNNFIGKYIYKLLRWHAQTATTIFNLTSLPLLNILLGLLFLVLTFFTPSIILSLIIVFISAINNKGLSLDILGEMYSEGFFLATFGLWFFLFALSGIAVGLNHLINMLFGL